MKANDLRAGMTITRCNFPNREILFIGLNQYFYRDIYGELSGCLDGLNEWQPKREYEIVERELWVNVYEGGGMGVSSVYTDLGIDCVQIKLKYKKYDDGNWERIDE